MAKLRRGNTLAGHTRKVANERIGQIVTLPGVETRLTAEHAIRAAIDTHVFSALRELESLDGGRAVQSVYVALIRRLPNVLPDRRRLSIDSGFSESSVKRAIALLEASGLARVERVKGRSSVYHLADLRSAEVAGECLSRIRKLARGTEAKRLKRGRVISEPSPDGSRVTGGPRGRVTCGEEVGSQVVQKETRKIQNKQQAAAVIGKGERTLLEAMLRKWGLSSASYLVMPGHERAIPLLASNPEKAAAIIDVTMREGKWSESSGVGARVSFLRENVERVNERFDKVAGTVQRKYKLSCDSASDEAEWRQGREELERAVEKMTETEFRASCERLFERNPGMRLLYKELPKESRGLKAALVELLKSEAAILKDGQALQVERTNDEHPLKILHGQGAQY